MMTSTVAPPINALLMGSATLTDNVLGTLRSRTGLSRQRLLSVRVIRGSTPKPPKILSPEINACHDSLHIKQLPAAEKGVIPIEKGVIPIEEVGTSPYITPCHVTSRASLHVASWDI